MFKFFGWLIKALLVVVILYMALNIINYLISEDIINNKPEEADVSISVEEIRRIAELSSIEYLMEARMIIEKPKDKLWIFDIPQTDKYYMAMAQGKVKAGIDLKQMEVISASKEEVRLKLPRAKILDSYIDPKTKWEKEFENLFSRIKAEEVTQAQIKAEEEMIERAIKNGILDKADDNAKEIIEEFLKMAGVKVVIFE